MKIIGYSLSLGLALASFYFKISWLESLGLFLSQAFLRLFQCLSLPILFFSLLAAISQMDHGIKAISRKTLFFTLFTTVASTLVAMCLYLLVSPETRLPLQVLNSGEFHSHESKNYQHFLIELIPKSFLSPFLDHQIMGVFFISLSVGFSLSQLPSEEQKKQLILLIQGIHHILLTMVQKVVQFMPFAFFGFVVEAIHQLQEQKGQGHFSLFSLGGYFSVIIGANLIQGVCVLPALLFFYGVKPFAFLKEVVPALSLAFFSKSSTGTLPVTIKTMEHAVKNPALARWILPLCTTINMNGCAAFIWTTCIYFMEIQGIGVSYLTMGLWILIATMAAIGNAGIPMGCFSLSLSLLTAMNIPVTLLVSFVLPIYSLIDMVETALNVWSDCCITKIVDHLEEI